MPPVPRLFTFASVVNLLLFFLALTAEVRGFFVQDVVWLRRSQLGSSVPAHPFDLPSMASADERMNVARYDPAFAHSRFDRYWSNTIYELHVSYGRVQLQKVEDYFKPAPLWDRRPVQWDPPTRSIGWRKLPAVLNGTGTTYIQSQSSAVRMVIHRPLEDVPLWPILAMTAILPAIWIVKTLRRPRRGFCPECSYNLTGNTSGVCPECGTRFKEASESVAI